MLEDNPDALEAQPSVSATDERHLLYLQTSHREFWSWLSFDFPEGGEKTRCQLKWVKNAHLPQRSVCLLLSLSLNF